MPHVDSRFLLMQEPVGSAAILHALGSATKQLLQPGCAAAQLWANHVCHALTGTIAAAWDTLEVVQQAIMALLCHHGISCVRTMLQARSCQASVMYMFACKQSIEHMYAKVVIPTSCNSCVCMPERAYSAVM